jgi:Zn/Cd-binding protein ZinT
MNLVLMFGAVTSIEKITDKKEEVSFINKGKEFKFTFDYSDENCEFKPLNVAD